MSSSSILGLVNQLHSMESSFAQILMEATLKLSTLTDTNVFLLLETPEGRRYCGKRHLCDVYKTQGLCPVENELEMELVSGVTSLQVRRQPPFQPNNSFVNAPLTLSSHNGSQQQTQQHSQHQALPPPQQHHHHHHQQQPQQPQQQPMPINSYGNRKRAHASEDASFAEAASRKQMRPSFSVLPLAQNDQIVVGNSSSTSSMASTDSIVLSTTTTTATTTTSCVGDEGGGGGGGVVFPSTSGDVARSCAEEGGDVVFIDVKKEDGDDRRCIANALEESYLDDQTGDRIQRLEGLQFGDAASSSSQMVTINAGSKGDVFLDSFARKAAVDQLTLEEKLEIMKGLSPETLLKPGSVDTEEYLIFQKVCYEFCRACALECPMDEEDVDAYFDANFNSFANVFPKLNTNVDVLYHMRLLTKRSYKQYLKTRGKRKNDHSKMATFFT